MTTPFIPSTTSLEGWRRITGPPSTSRESSGGVRWALAGLRKWQNEIGHIRTLPYKKNGERWPATIPAWRGFRWECGSLQSGGQFATSREGGPSRGSDVSP